MQLGHRSKLSNFLTCIEVPYGLAVTWDHWWIQTQSIEAACFLLFPVDSLSTVCQFPGSGSTWPLDAEFIITSG